uniref:Verticillium wilt resistance n=1 Tax=Solanum tuberosum TaxID=4113 RepID=M1BZU9_SOLTU
MKISLLLQLSFITMLVVLFLINSPVYGHCLGDQKALLLKLKNGLTFDSSRSTKLVRWNQNTDCCQWPGVSCDQKGHVLVLELDNEAIFSGLENPTSLFDLQYLEKLNLAYNHLNSIQIATEVYKLTNLTYLNLSFAGFGGKIPMELSRLTKLTFLDLSNVALKLESGDLKTLVGNLANLRELYLDEVHISWKGIEWCSTLSSSLPQLRVLSMTNCGISSPFDPILLNLHFLSVIRLDGNNLSSIVPEFLANFTKLTTLSLSNCNLRGPLSSTHFGGLSELEYLYLEDNSIGGTLPTVVFSIPSLQVLELQNNHFSGEVHEFANASSSFLYELDLSNNYLNGSIPRSIFKLNRLSQLSLSSNSFSGTINIEAIKGLPRLKTLDLSYNNLRIDVQGNNSTSFPFPQMSELNLASCQLQKFPDLKNQSLMIALDLSYNNISGQVPSWIWSNSLSYLNLSCNFLEALEEPYDTSSELWSVIDLHNNRIHGNIPIVPTSLIYLSIANNKLTGSIPSSICNLYQLQFLDMSNNSINSKLPPCLFQMFDYLSVLNLGRNRLSGIILDTFLSNCSLKTLDLSNNNLEGKVPRSLQRCAFLEVLDIGNNKIRDTFPCMLKTLPSLHILVLRSNKFYGDLQCRIANQTWSKLQIIDIASNNFRGALLPHYFSNLEGMMKSRNPEPRLHYLEVEFINYGLYYRNRVTLTLKGQEMEIENILEVFTSIDFSSNNFEGEIPEVLGDLKLLYLLNFSHNALTGRIPKALGKLSQLGSLDLSVNQLSGRIPDELASLTFLAFLNLSFNQLSGRIPRGNQLQTFSAESFEGSTGLCDFPLKKLCSDTKMHGSSQPRSHSDDETVDGKYISFALGSSLCFGIVTWLLLHSTRYNGLVDRLLFRIFGEHKKAGRNRNRRRSR